MPKLSAPAPRGPDGKPDLTGVWDARPVVARPDPANLQPWVLERSRQNQQEYYKGRPYYQCRPSGPEAERFGGWKRILQTPTTIAILNDDLTYRVIHMDGRELEADCVFYATGRRPMLDNLGLENTGVKLDKKGFVEVDEQGEEVVYDTLA